MIPGLAAILAPDNGEEAARPDDGRTQPKLWPRRIVLAILLTGMAVQKIYFQSVFRREGPKRGVFFDADYKDVYDAAIALSVQPIYLVDGNQPSYEHALWYATVEGRPREFIHLEEGYQPPTGALVISSEERCLNCMIIKRSGGYFLYRAQSDFLP